MRLIINGTPGPVILHNGYRIPQAFGGSSFAPAFQWPERTVPRTEKPVRFIPFVGSPSYTTRAECRAKSLRFPA